MEWFFKFMQYKVVGGLATLIFSIYNVTVFGKKNFPKGRGCILASNHLSFLDAPFIAWAIYTPVHWLVNKVIYDTWYFRPFCVIFRCVPVNGSTKLAERIVNSDRPVGIFPQGGICCSRLIKKGRKGVAVMALKTGAPVIPFFIDGKIDESKEVNFLPDIRHPLNLYIGKPLYFQKYDGERVPDELLNDALEKIINAVNELSPELRKERIEGETANEKANIK